MKNPLRKLQDNFQSLLLLLFTFFFLLAFSYLPQHWLTINSNFTLRQLDLFSSLETPPKYKNTAHLTMNKEPENDRGESDFNFAIQEDSLWVDFSIGKSYGMNKFYLKLADKSRKKKIRVAYFGDSMIEGDLIVRDLRSLMQQKYGGMGVGMVPLTSATAGFRQTIKHSFNDNWTEFNLLLKNNPLPPGITGHVFLPRITGPTDTLTKPEQASWCSYAPVAQPQLNEFKKASIFYGPTTSENFLFVQSKNGKSRVVSLNGKLPVNKLDLPESLIKNGLTLTFAPKENLPLYAVNFDADTGVYIDNFSFRGNSGMPLTRIPKSILTGLNEQEPYDLIILQYGLNAASPAVTDYHWYEAGLVNMVEHIKRCFPDAAILMITPGDKSYKENGEWVTDPGLLRVIDAEKNVARKSSIAFYNFFLEMGGKNSMVEWAESNPPKANKDYTHFNFRGASIAGKMIFERLQKEAEACLKQEKLMGSTKLPSLN